MALTGFGGEFWGGAKWRNGLRVRDRDLRTTSVVSSTSLPR